MKKILMLLAALFVVGTANAQVTISPVVGEFQAKKDLNAVSNGQVVITNDGIFPLVVSIEALSFEVTDPGQPQILKPLSSDIKVQWETTSAKVAAKQSYTFYFKATCAKAPCWFLTLATAMGPKPKVEDEGTSAGVQIALRLPSATYVYGHTPVTPKDIKLTWDSNTLLVANTSAQAARVKSIEAHYSGGRVVKSGAFPVLPRGIRGSDRAIKFEEKPDYVVVNFPKFSIDSRGL
jgi:hypothetical protein